MREHRWTSEVLRTEEDLRHLLGVPAPLTCAKIADRLNEVTRRFVELSPFLCVATADARVNCDVSPRGDPRGFVRILDDRTLLVPERPGNRLADSLRNILQNPRAALWFLIPGVTDTFRVNGTATLTTDRGLLAPSRVEGKTPKLGILLDVEEAYTHCSKALLRSRLWETSEWLERSTLPSQGEVYRALDPEFDAPSYDAARAERYARREGFY